MRGPLVISILLSSMKFGGAERAALNLANALATEGCQVEFLLMSNEGEFLDETLEKFPVIDLRCDRTWKLPLKLVLYLIRARPDAFISSFWKLNLCACLARLASPRTRLLLWEHSQPTMSSNSPTWLYAVTASLVYRMANRVIAVSTGVRNDILGCTIGLGTKLEVVVNPIPPPGGLSQSVIESRDGRNLVWVGRLDSPKNPELALEAFALVAASRNYFLRFIGDGALRAILIARCHDLGLADRVSFMGFQKRPYDVMRASDVLVLSSDREGLGNVLVEALYCGLGVVSTDCGEGVQDVLQGGRYGRVVPRGDKVQLANAMMEELANRRDHGAQVRGAQRFLPELAARRFLDIIRS